MKKIHLFIFGCLLLCYSCTKELNAIHIDFAHLTVRFSNHTNESFDNATLYIGAKNSSNSFIAIDSIQFQNIPSNISPIDRYSTNMDNFFTKNIGFHEGYFYCKINGEQFVRIPFPDSIENSMQLEKEKLLAISSNFGFLLKLSNGKEGYIEGYNLNHGIPNPTNEYGGYNYVKVDIKSSGISGFTTSQVIN